MNISPYLALIRKSFLHMLAYRSRYYTGIMTYLLFVSVNYFIWKAVYASHNFAVINGFTFAEMVTYISVGWISRSLYYSDIDDKVDDLVTTGQISNYLLRPLNFQWMMLFEAVGESLFRLVCFTLPIAVVIFSLFPISAPASLMHLLLYFLSTFFGFWIFAELNFIIGLGAFYLQSIDGIMRAKYFLMQLLSGLLLPLSFFPTWFRWFVEILPFKMVAYVPLQFYLGKFNGAEIGAVLSTQILWILSLHIFGFLFYIRAFRRLTIQGG